MTLRRSLEITLLVLTAVASVATSKKGDSPGVVSYGVATTCAAVSNQVITVSAGIITSPAGMTFTTLGLPVSVLNVAVDTSVTGTMSSGSTRSCTYSLYNTGSENIHRYECSDTISGICNVTFTPDP